MMRAQSRPGAVSHILPLAILLLALGTQHLAAQQELLTRTQAFTSHDINVIVSPSENDLISVIFGLEGGIMGGETDNPALGEFATDLITSSGSSKISKQELRQFVSRTSTELYGAADLRGVRYIMTSTRPHFDEAWDVLASIVMTPQYDENEFRNIMNQRLAAARRRWAQPEGFAHLISDSLLKMPHPVLSQSILPEHVESVTIAKLRELMGRLTERARLLVVVVGNVTPDQIREKLAAFKSVPRGSYRNRIVDPLPAITAPQVLVIDRPGAPTTYVSTSFVGPSVRDDDYWPLQVGMSFLRNRLFEEVRTKRNLSYAPQSYLMSSLGQGLGFLEVSSVHPDSTITVMFNELERMRRGDFDAKELEDSKQVFITGFYLGRNTSADKAAALFMAQRNVGDWRRAFDFEIIERVTKQDVERAFQRWAKLMHVGIVGPALGIHRDRYIFRFSDDR